MFISSRKRRARREDWWLRAGYSGLLGFFALEWLFRQPGSAAALEASEGDQGTTRLIIAAYAAATDLPLVTRRLGAGRLPAAAAPIGLFVEGLGLMVRGYSMRTLGASYSRTLKTMGDDQAVVQTGPYRFIRHPGYLGSLLTWTGFAVTSRSLPTIALVSGLLGAAYGRRITAEEQMLRRDLPGYEQYALNTKRMIPFLW